jgi:uncharacterized protein (TIGR00369 family)
MTSPADRQHAQPQPADPCEAYAAVPFTRWLGLRRSFSEGGRARFELEPGPEHGNVIGAAHGGVLATMLDVAMASAAVSHVNFAMTAVTLGMSLGFLNPGRGRLVADGELLAVDAGVARCRAEVTDAQGLVVARAQGSFRYLARP